MRYLADGTLLVPMRDAAGELHSLQRIAPAPPADGAPEKRFLPGGRKSGLFHLIGQAEGAAVLLAEGYATAASLHQATGRPAAVGFDAVNLVHVAKALRERWPALPLLVCADDDGDTEARTGKNPGETRPKRRHVLHEVFRKEMCQGFDPEAVAKLLQRRQHLVHEPDRLTVKHRLPGIGKAPCYHLKPSVFCDEL